MRNICDMSDLRRQRTLEWRRQRYRERPRDETTEEKERRLQSERERRRGRLLGELAEAKEARLQRQCSVRRECRVAEQEQAREAKLESERLRMRERRAVQQGQARQATLERNRLLVRECREAERERREAEHECRIASVNQEWVQSKISAFHAKLACEFHHCSCCNEIFPSLKLSSLSVCSRCLRDVLEPKLYSEDNNMDPGAIPPALQELTQVEEMLISPVMPMMSVYRLPHGQLGYGGHVINLPQDVASFVSSLPRYPSNLDLVVIRKESTTGSHKDFRVRRSRVLRALQWLRENNVYFHDISLDHSVLDELPEDGDLPEISVVTPVNEAGEGDSFAESSHVEEDNWTSGSFIPFAHRRVTEQEAIQQAVSGQQQPPIVSWPQVGDSPLNEFHSEGYITRAFPTLFPTAAADFTAPRVRPVTIGYYMKHMMLYRDGRFAKHPRFRYFALNTEMRWRA